MHNKFKLFKRNVSGSIQEYTILLVGNKYKTFDRIIGSKKTQSKWIEFKPTSFLSAEQNARQKIRTLLSYKKSEGFVSNVTLIDGVYNLKSLKPHEFDRYSHWIKYPCFVQPSVEGEQIIQDRISARNNQNQKIFTSTYEIVKGLFRHFPDLTLDGQLKDDIYYVYDMYLDSESGLPFSERKKLLHSIVEGMSNLTPLIKTIKVMNNDMLGKICEMFLKQGYKEILIRLDLPYVQNDIPSLIKRKL